VFEPRGLVTTLALLCLAALEGGAQEPSVRRAAGVAAIEGAVTDTALVPLAGATVSILGSTVRVVTGESGRFRIAALPPGSYIVLVHRLGYEPLSERVQLSGVDTQRVSFSLERVATALETVVVSGPRLPARFEEFESRLRLHAATASFTRDDILKVNPVDTWQMLSRVPSVIMTPFGKTGGRFPVSNRGMVASKGGACYMSVVIDGVYMPSDPGKPAYDLANLPAPGEIHGIEVFAGPASIPPQYNGAGNGKMCGLIAIWTK
jgi:hypothetical protein